MLARNSEALVGMSTVTWEQAEADLRCCPRWATTAAGVSWYFDMIMLTPGSELDCLRPNGPCVSYSSLRRTATASSELRNPHLNWAFLKDVFLIGNICMWKKCKYINSRFNSGPSFFLQRQPVLPSFLFIVLGMCVCVYTPLSLFFFF